jgi:hypothetical protein
MGSIQETTFRNIAFVGNQYLSRAIIQGLFKSKFYTLTIITYPNQKPYLPKNVDAASIVHKTTDFSPQSLETALEGQELVICTISPGDINLQTYIVDACIIAGMQGFVPNEFGLDSQNVEVQRRLSSYATRNELIQYLKSKEDKLEWAATAVGTILLSL